MSVGTAVRQIFRIDCLLAISFAFSQTPPPALDTVLARASDVAEQLHREVPVLVASESYVQRLRPSPSDWRRPLAVTSRFSVLWDESTQAWRSRRAVLVMAGHGVSAPGWSPYRSTEEVSPLTALSVLLSPHRPRFTFSKRAEERRNHSSVWVVAFRETGEPMFFRDLAGRPVPMSGEIWVDTASGAVLRSVFSLAADGPDMLAAASEYSRLRVEVAFEPHPVVGFAVPVEMTQTLSVDVPEHTSWELLSPSHVPLRRQELDCRATYTNHRKALLSGW
jgi:hypothetical protein